MSDVGVLLPLSASRPGSSAGDLRLRVVPGRAVVRPPRPAHHGGRAARPAPLRRAPTRDRRRPGGVPPAWRELAAARRRAAGRVPAPHASSRPTPDGTRSRPRADPDGAARRSRRCRASPASPSELRVWLRTAVSGRAPSWCSARRSTARGCWPTSPTPTCPATAAGGRTGTRRSRSASPGSCRRGDSPTTSTRST